MSNATSSPALQPDREPPAALRGAKRWAWPFWGLPGAFLFFISVLLNALFVSGTSYSLMDDVAVFFALAGLAVSALAPIAAAAVDGRLRTADALVAIMGAIVGLALLDASSWSGGEASAVKAAFRTLFLVVGIVAYLLYVAVCFGIAALVRRLRKRSAAADPPAKT